MALSDGLLCALSPQHANGVEGVAGASMLVQTQGCADSQSAFYVRHRMSAPRKRKVDLARISILELAEQYLQFMEAARRRRLDLAADYLVMAAWLAFLKSKMLLPKPKKDEDEAPAEVMAAALAFRLRRLEAMRAAGEALFAQPLLHTDVHPGGQPDGVRSTRSVIYEADLHDLLSAYSRRRIRQVPRLDRAAQRLQRIVFCTICIRPQSFNTSADAAD